ncbi:MAG: hypothetical protein A2Z71_08370 [Chloroflexi bacterium RBG_13_50_21]|nr:MAG: hypothetical protein A2Z71_08370 [Chloroflexi bacterium RBG_13_50_21]
MKRPLQQILRSAAPVILLIGIAALCYMSLAHLFGYYNDDWYLIYSGTSQGVKKFHDIFAIDRPFRGYFVGWIFNLFGVNPWLYSVGAFIMRCISALGFLWVLRMVWPREKRATFVAALLFVVYPGFLDQPNAIDYQSHQWSFALAILSIGCTLQMARSQKYWAKLLWMILSVATQIIYLALMEYYIGLEGLRLLLLAFLYIKQNPAEPKKWVSKTILGLLPNILVLVGFMYWRTQIFQAERLDINSMFSNVEESPVLRLAWMAVYMLKDMLNAIIYSWTEPVYHYAFAMRLKLFLLAFGFALVAGCLAWFALSFYKNDTSNLDHNTDDKKTSREMIIIGLLTVLIALVPIHLGNRQIIFDSYSRFSLPASGGGVLVLVGTWLTLGKTRITKWIIVILVSLATLSHIGNALSYAENWKIVRDFWWQVSWRVPQLKEGTVLMADYAGRGIPEDYGVWGPANLIYYPKLDPNASTDLKLTAATLNIPDVDAAISQAIRMTDRRSIYSESNFNNLLVLSMPSESSCVHVLDGENLELSDSSRSEIIAVAPHSKINQIGLTGEGITPPTSIFGDEPAPGWCYYYQKADLARQRGDWQEVVRLGNLVMENDLRPYDVIEWMPFIEGFAYAMQEAQVHHLSTIIRDNLFYRYQACKLVETDSRQMEEQFPEGHHLLFQELCQP